jgi:fatty acid synthase subunit alpha
VLTLWLALMFFAGRSSLENEIVGDLNEEFGALPERPEDIAAQELGALQQVSFEGRLGKKSSTLIERMIGSVMPAGFTFDTTRSYLDRRWGLGTGRQDGVLLLALSMQPPKRLASVQEAHKFLDVAVENYASHAGLSLSEAAPSSADRASIAVVDPYVLNTLMQDQKGVTSEIFEVLARHVDDELNGKDQALSDIQQNVVHLQSELDVWTQEHGETYGFGIRPVFSSFKMREYDSSWNWVVQDFRIMLEDLS